MISDYCNKMVGREQKGDSSVLQPRSLPPFSSQLQYPDSEKPEHARLPDQTQGILAFVRVLDGLYLRACTSSSVAFGSKAVAHRRSRKKGAGIVCSDHSMAAASQVAQLPRRIIKVC